MFVLLRLSQCSTPLQNYTSTAAHDCLLIVDLGGHEDCRCLAGSLCDCFPYFVQMPNLIILSQNSQPKQILKRILARTTTSRYCYALKLILITAQLGASRVRRERDSVSLRFSTPGIPTTQPTSPIDAQASSFSQGSL